MRQSKPKTLAKRQGWCGICL